MPSICEKIAELHSADEAEEVQWRGRQGVNGPRKETRSQRGIAEGLEEEVEAEQADVGKTEENERLYQRTPWGFWHQPIPAGVYVCWSLKDQPEGSPKPVGFYVRQLDPEISHCDIKKRRIARRCDTEISPKVGLSSPGAHTHEELQTPSPKYVPPWDSCDDEEDPPSSQRALSATEIWNAAMRCILPPDGGSSPDVDDPTGEDDLQPDEDEFGPNILWDPSIRIDPSRLEDEIWHEIPPDEDDFQPDEEDPPTSRRAETPSPFPDLPDSEEEAQTSRWGNGWDHCSRRNHRLPPRGEDLTLDEPQKSSFKEPPCTNARSRHQRAASSGQQPAASSQQPEQPAANSHQI